MKTDIVKIVTERFVLRNINEDDATLRYLNWLEDTETRRFIALAQKQKKISDLKDYIKSRINRNDVLFLGIFDISTGTHIGNIKYEPINSVLGYAIMGILIGDPLFRGKGVALEVLTSSAAYLKQQFNITQILLGVSKHNTRAIHAYEKVGFVAGETPYVKFSDPGNISMIWHI